MIQDIHPHRVTNKFIITTGIQENDYIFHFKENSLLLKQCNEGYEIPRKKEIAINETNNTFLFTLNNTNCFLVWDCKVPDNGVFSFQEINFFRGMNLFRNFPVRQSV